MRRAALCASPAVSSHLGVLENVHPNRLPEAVAAGAERLVDVLVAVVAVVVVIVLVVFANTAGPLYIFVVSDTAGGGVWRG